MLSTGLSNGEDFSYCFIRGLKHALLDANAEIHGLKRTLFKSYRELTEKESSSIKMKVECDRLKDESEKNISNLQLRVNDLEAELKDKENENVNLNFKVNELKAFVEEKMKEIDCLRAKNESKAQKSTSKDVYRIKYRVFMRNLKTIMRTAQSKPDAKVLQEITNLILKDDEKELSLPESLSVHDYSEPISIKITLPDLLSLNATDNFSPLLDISQNHSSVPETVPPEVMKSESKEELPDLILSKEDTSSPTSDVSEEKIYGDRNFELDLKTEECYVPENGNLEVDSENRNLVSAVNTPFCTEAEDESPVRSKTETSVFSIFEPIDIADKLESNPFTERLSPITVISGFESVDLADELKSKSCVKTEVRSSVNLEIECGSFSIFEPNNTVDELKLNEPKLTSKYAEQTELEDPDRKCRATPLNLSPINRMVGDSENFSSNSLPVQDLNDIPKNLSCLHVSETFDRVDSSVFDIIHEMTFFHRVGLKSEKIFAEFANQIDDHPEDERQSCYSDERSTKRDLSVGIPSEDCKNVNEKPCSGERNAEKNIAAKVSFTEHEDADSEKPCLSDEFGLKKQVSAEAPSQNRRIVIGKQPCSAKISAGVPPEDRKIVINGKPCSDGRDTKIIVTEVPSPVSAQAEREKCFHHSARNVFAEMSPEASKDVTNEESYHAGQKELKKKIATPLFSDDCEHIKRVKLCHSDDYNNGSKVFVGEYSNESSNREESHFDESSAVEELITESVHNNDEKVRTVKSSHPGSYDTEEEVIAELIPKYDEDTESHSEYLKSPDLVFGGEESVVSPASDADDDVKPEFKDNGTPVPVPNTTPCAKTENENPSSCVSRIIDVPVFRSVPMASELQSEVLEPTVKDAKKIESDVRAVGNCAFDSSPRKMGPNGVHPDVFEVINEMTLLHKTTLKSNKIFEEFANEADNCVDAEIEEKPCLSDKHDTEYILFAEVFSKDDEDAEDRLPKPLLCFSDDVLADQIVTNPVTDVNLETMKLSPMDLQQSAVNITIDTETNSPRDATGDGQSYFDEDGAKPSARHRHLSEQIVPANREPVPVNLTDDQSDIEEDKLVIDEDISTKCSKPTEIAKCGPDLSSCRSSADTIDVPPVARDCHHQYAKNSSQYPTDSVVENIAVKNMSTICERVASTSSHYNLRQKTIPNFRFLAKGSFGNRKKGGAVKVATEDANAEIEHLNPKSALASQDASINTEPDGLTIPVIDAKDEANVEMKLRFDSQPSESPMVVTASTCGENVESHGVDVNEIDETANQKSCLPKFYVENREEVTKPMIKWVSPFDEIWSRIKYMRFETPELLNENEENDLVPCSKSVPHMAFYSKKNKPIPATPGEKMIKLDQVRKALGSYRQETKRNSKLALHNLLISISQSNKTTVSRVMAAMVTNSGKRETLQDVKIIQELVPLCIEIEFKLFKGFLEAMKSHLKAQMFAKVFKVDENSGGHNMISCTILWSRFYTVLCKTTENMRRVNDDISNVLNLVYESLDILKNRAHPIAYGVLTEWPKLFSYSIPQSGLLIPMILFSLIHHKMTYNVLLYKTVEVQKLIGQLYGVKLGNKTAEQYAQEAMQKVDDPYWVDAIVLLCKRQMFPWTYTHVVMKYMLPILRKWETENFCETIVFNVLQALQKIILACPCETTQNHVYNLDAVVQVAASILSDHKSSRKLKETAAVLLCELSAWRFATCSNLLCSWAPADGLISSHVLLKLKDIMHKRKHRPEWLTFFAPPDNSRKYKKKQNATESKAKQDKPDGVISVGVSRVKRTFVKKKKKKKKPKVKSVNS